MTRPPRVVPGRRVYVPTEDDRRVWEAVVRGVLPLGRNRRGVNQADPPPAPAAQPVPNPPPAPPQPAHTPARHRQPTAELRHGDSAGIDRRTADRFRRGQMAIEASIDLHGLSQAHAHAALRAFLHRAWHAGQRAVIVVTGKGGRAGAPGVLRAEVPRWLNEPDLRPMVLSFSFARPRDGGEGALYILLRRHRE